MVKANENLRKIYDADLSNFKDFQLTNSEMDDYDFKVKLIRFMMTVEKPSVLEKEVPTLLELRKKHGPRFLNNKLKTSHLKIKTKFLNLENERRKKSLFFLSDSFNRKNSMADHLNKVYENRNESPESKNDEEKEEGDSENEGETNERVFIKKRVN